MVILMDLKRLKLPKSLMDKIVLYGVKQEDFIYRASVDMDNAGRYANGYIILTKSRLIVAFAPKDERTVYYFGGLKDEKSKIEIGTTSGWVINAIKLDGLDELNVQMLVSGGLLIAKRDGIDQDIAIFTNSCMNEINQLVKFFQKLKNGDELEEADFESNKQDDICPTFGSRYPNKDRKICPKCMDKHSIFMRVMNYFSPYKIKLIIMMLCFL